MNKKENNYFQKFNLNIISSATTLHVHLENDTFNSIYQSIDN